MTKKRAHARSHRHAQEQADHGFADLIHKENLDQPTYGAATQPHEALGRELLETVTPGGPQAKQRALSIPLAVAAKLQRPNSCRSVTFLVRGSWVRADHPGKAAHDSLREDGPSAHAGGFFLS